MMLVRKDAPFSRGEFVKCLDEARIGNRMLFGGNLVTINLAPAAATFLGTSSQAKGGYLHAACFCLGQWLGQVQGLLRPNGQEDPFLSGIQKSTGVLQQRWITPRIAHILVFGRAANLV